MIILDQKEFQSRLKAIMQARKIFVPDITKSIDKAFDIYRELLAEEQYEQFMSNMRTHVGVPLKFYQKYFVPKCPICGTKLHFRLIRGKPKSRENLKGWKTAWFCDHENCVYEKYSTLTPHEWMKKLERKAKKHGNGRFLGVHTGGKSLHKTGCC